MQVKHAASSVYPGLNIVNYFNHYLHVVNQISSSLPVIKNITNAIETGTFTVNKNTGDEQHPVAAVHLAAASAHYSAAAGYHKEGDHDKAHESIIAALNSLQLAVNAQKEELKQLSQKG